VSKRTLAFTHSQMFMHMHTHAHTHTTHSRNNGYAISTPTHEQYRGDGIVSRAPGYGIDSIRVDGNDVFAVHNATRAARDIAVRENRPVLVEAMTYRIGHHSTSDDSTAYRGALLLLFSASLVLGSRTLSLSHTHITPGREEVTTFTQDTPIERLGKYMRKQGIWNDEKEDLLVETVRKVVRDEFDKAEKIPKPNLEHLFTDVLDTLPARLEAQRKEMFDHISKYPGEYPTENYDKNL
jgi:2-oxoisovalerate dehydrogenase E1 component alpha subunit